MTPALVTELKRLERAVGEGVWELEDYRDKGDWRSTGLIWARDKGEGHPGTPVCRIDANDLHAVSAVAEIESFEVKAQLIVALRNAAPALLEAVETMHAALEFYADGNGNNVGEDAEFYPLHVGTIRERWENSFGKRARKALARVAALLGEGREK